MAEWPGGARPKGAHQLVGGVGALGVSAFAVTLWALPQHIFPALEPLRIGAVTAALMWLALVFRFVLGGKAPTAGGYRGVALVLFLAIALLSPAWSLDPAASTSSSHELLKMGLVYVAAASLVDTPQRLRRALWAVALAGCVPAYYAVSNSITGTDLLDGYRARWVGTFLDPNRLSMSVVASALLLFGLRARLRSPLLRALALGLVGLQFAAVVVTYSRGASLGLGAGLLAYVIATRGSKLRAVALVSGAMLGLVALAPSQFWTRTESIALYEQDLSAQGRIDAWRTAGNILERRPLTGVGVGAFLAAWVSYAPGDVGPGTYVAHNLLLEIAAELGIPALFAFLCLAGACLVGTFRAARRSVTIGAEARGVLAAVVGYLVCQLFAGYLMSFFLFLILGLCAAAERIAHPASQVPRRTPIPLRLRAEAPAL